eukprot:Filipodium_phascolosomae@DN6797_c0_g1_i1.p1
MGDNVDVCAVANLIVEAANDSPLQNLMSEDALNNLRKHELDCDSLSVKKFSEDFNRKLHCTLQSSTIKQTTASLNAHHQFIHTVQRFKDALKSVVACQDNNENLSMLEVFDFLLAQLHDAVKGRTLQELSRLQSIAQIHKKKSKRSHSSRFVHELEVSERLLLLDAQEMVELLHVSQYCLMIMVTCFQLTLNLTRSLHRLQRLAPSTEIASEASKSESRLPTSKVSSASSTAATTATIDGSADRNSEIPRTPNLLTPIQICEVRYTFNF